MVVYRSRLPVWWNGRHKGLKIPRRNNRAGSSPATGTKISLSPCGLGEIFRNGRARTGRRLASRKKQSGGLFFSPRTRSPATGTSSEAPLLARAPAFRRGLLAGRGVLRFQNTNKCLFLRYGDGRIFRNCYTCKPDVYICGLYLTSLDKI